MLQSYIEDEPLSMANEKGDMARYRVTANPLMLSMVASVFELRHGVAMPTTVTELYSLAADAMLARGGVASDQLRSLLCEGRSRRGGT